ncbi:hypothetical protein EVAR_76723_1 [Eumeta japonica]|uniref:Uncharacterized protein n=1 Tax=Eumeta variegata TaxID=151549 RepID=A0A4C1SSQ9_EUMVA|nr:hypothetical protein EVAR_76723_1 [Eumeta japonica]
MWCEREDGTILRDHKARTFVERRKEIGMVRNREVASDVTLCTSGITQSRLAEANQGSNFLRSTSEATNSMSNSEQLMTRVQRLRGRRAGVRGASARHLVAGRLSRRAVSRFELV